MDWLGAEVADPTGHRYARLDEIFVGRTSGRPEFGIVTLLEGPGDAERVAVPLTGARTAADGSLILDVDDERVRAAPRVQRDIDEIPAEAGRLIAQHFGVDASTSGGEAETVAVEPLRSGDDTEPTEVVRHEEQLSVGTRAEATERVRVRKRVVTEDVTLTVTLRREELVIERTPVEPGTAARDAGAADFAFAEEGAEAEFLLHAEEPVPCRHQARRPRRARACTATRPPRTVTSPRRFARSSSTSTSPPRCERTHSHDPRTPSA